MTPKHLSITMRQNNRTATAAASPRATLLAWALALALPLGLVGLAQPALAQASQTSALPSDELPPLERLRASILARPEVQAANAAIKADAAEGERLIAGPHEYTVRLSGQQRRATEALATGGSEQRRFGEAQVSLERTLRLGGKAAQDQAIGDAGLALARLRRADAIHESTRTFVRSWFDWLRNRTVVQLWQDQAGAQAELLRQTERRVKAGDAARTEVSVQQAASAQVQAYLAAALAQERSSRAMLDVYYPGLTDSAPSAVLPPGTNEPVPQAQPQVMPLLLERSHEWGVARLQADLALARARRVSLDERADPTVGVYAASERAGAERLMGVSVSVPFGGGTGRNASSRAAMAWADEAAQKAELVRHKVAAEAAAQWVATQSARSTWQSQVVARDSAELALKTALRGWQLGEFAQADVLMARRQFIEAALAEITARTEARHADLRLSVDLHERLEFDEE
jgi:cobalt-zinc-cadmium efflux system outer membrane protein